MATAATRHRHTFPLGVRALAAVLPLVSERVMSDERIPGLHVAAILSWYYWCPEARAAHEKTDMEWKSRVERFRSALAQIFGGKCDFQITHNGGCIETEIEGLRLIGYEFTTKLTTEICTMVTLLGRCPSCGVETMSEPFENLAGLGRMLEKFEPICKHSCPRR